MDAANDIKFHEEIQGSFMNACRNMTKWIVSEGLKREQIISISLHETQIELGKASVVVFYRQAADVSMGSLENLEFNLLQRHDDNAQATLKEGIASVS
jgi:hypothetical protein